jgi:O-antigen ligase
MSFSKWVQRWGPACALVGLIVGSDYKYRVRDTGSALSGGGDVTIMLELTLYGVALFVVLARRRTLRLIAHPVLPILVASTYVGLMVTSVTYASFPQYALVRSTQMVIVLVLVNDAATSLDRGHFHRFAHLFVVVVMAGIVYGVIEPSTPVNRLQEGRFTWLAIHPTVSGILAGLAMIVCLAYALWGQHARLGPKWPPVAYWLLFMATGLATILVRTRGAVLGAVGGVVVLLLFALRGRRRLRIVGAVLASGAIAVWVSWGTIISYFVRDSTPEQLTTLNSRTQYWSVIFKAVIKEPLVGYGTGSARGLFVEETGLGGGHNAVINVLVELGLVGLMCWSALIAVTVVGVIRIRRRIPREALLDRAMILAVLTFVLLDGLFYDGPGGTGNVSATWLFTCVGWYASMRYAERRASENEAIDQAESSAANAAPIRARYAEGSNLAS